MLPADLILKDVMANNPVRVRADERLDIALALMSACRLRHLPVTEGTQLVGMLSFRDIQRASRSRLTTTPAQQALHLRTVEVRDAMTRPVLSAPPDEAVLDALQFLVDRRISALPVVGDGVLLGIVTRTDFLGICAAVLDAAPKLRGRPTPVRKLMTRSPITLQPNDTLEAVSSILHAQRIHHLPVVDDGRLVGLISDVDLLAAESAPTDPLGPAARLAARHWTHVRDAMETRVVTISPDDPAAAAARVLAQRRIGCLPVVVGGTLEGILTVADCIGYLLSQAPERPAMAVVR